MTTNGAAFAGDGACADAVAAGLRRCSLRRSTVPATRT